VVQNKLFFLSGRCKEKGGVTILWSNKAMEEYEVKCTSQRVEWLQ